MANIYVYIAESIKGCYMSTKSIVVVTIVLIITVLFSLTTAFASDTTNYIFNDTNNSLNSRICTAVANNDIA